MHCFIIIYRKKIRLIGLITNTGNWQNICQLFSYWVRRQNNAHGIWKKLSFTVFLQKVNGKFQYFTALIGEDVSIFFLQIVGDCIWSHWTSRRVWSISVLSEKLFASIYDWCFFVRGSWKTNLILWKTENGYKLENIETEIVMQQIADIQW